jgi:hypothetical protein
MMDEDRTKLGHVDIVGPEVACDYCATALFRNETEGSVSGIDLGQGKLVGLDSELTLGPYLRSWHFIPNDNPAPLDSDRDPLVGLFIKDLNCLLASSEHVAQSHVSPRLSSGANGLDNLQRIRHAGNANGRLA